MNALRKVYRFPPLEILLLLCIIYQLLSGLFLVVNYVILVIKRQLELTFVKSVQIVTGLYLSFFVVYHIKAVMFGRYYWNVETDFFFAAAGVRDPVSVSFFVPYYSFSILSVFAHLACVHFLKMSERMQRTTSTTYTRRDVRMQAMLIFVSGVLVTCCIMMGLGGVHIAE